MRAIITANTGSIKEPETQISDMTVVSRHHSPYSVMKRIILKTTALEWH